MNKLKITTDDGNTHCLLVQLVDANNPSRVMGSPIAADTLREFNGIVLPEGRALLVTVGKPMPYVPPSSLGVVGKQEPGTQHPGALAKHADSLQNADPAGEQGSGATSSVLEKAFDHLDVGRGARKNTRKR